MRSGKMFDRPRVIPCLLVDDKRLVKTIRFRKPNYLGDPINAVRIYNEKMVDELCILDITRKRENELDFEFLHSIATEAFMPLSYGGGIQNIQQIKKLFHIGFEKIIINSSLVENPDLVTEAVKYAGSQSIIASIDVKRSFFQSYCCIKNGKINTKLHPGELARRAQELGVGEILLNSIDRDGTMLGYDTELISKISSLTNIPIIACGGAGNLFDMKKAIISGAHAVAAGSIFVYYGAKKGVLINYPSEEDFISSGIFF